jgi:hypothetical protein
MPDLPKKPRGPKANTMQNHIDDMTCEGPETRAQCLAVRALHEHTKQAFNKRLHHAD